MISLSKWANQSESHSSGRELLLIDRDRNLFHHRPGHRHGLGPALGPVLRLVDRDRNLLHHRPGHRHGLGSALGPVLRLIDRDRNLDCLDVVDGLIDHLVLGNQGRGGLGLGRCRHRRLRRGLYSISGPHHGAHHQEARRQEPPQSKPGTPRRVPHTAVSQ